MLCHRGSKVIFIAPAYVTNQYVCTLYRTVIPARQPGLIENKGFRPQKSEFIKTAFMNKALYDTYKKLSDTERSELNFKFKDSPVGLKLLEFLEKCENRNFKNSDAVKFVYPGDATSYSILENRYFKLRKKIADELQAPSSINPSQILTDEELKLYRCKNLVLNDNKEEAFRQLSELEKDCWQKNIFELLPAIIDQLIFFNQSFNRNDDNKQLFQKLEKAIQLQHDMNRFLMIARQVYEINYRKGIRHAKKELNSLKEIASKHDEFPRFLMCYHHISLYYKLGSQDYITEMQVVSRHLAEFKKLYAQNPLMPLISYKVNYVKYQHFHFNQSTMFYHFNRCEFEEAYQCMNEVWDLVHASGSIFGMYKSESFYNNMFTVQRVAGKYEEANRTSDFFINFLKENNQQNKLCVAYTQKARLYADIYPNTGMIKMDFSYLLAQVDEYIREVKKTGNAQLSFEQVLALKMQLLLIRKDYGKAKEIMKMKEVQDYLEPVNCFELFREFMFLLENKTPASKEFQELSKKASAQKYKAVTPNEMMNLKWIINFIDKLQKQK
jgi:hypothetical protein